MELGEEQAEEFLTTLAFERAWQADDVDAVHAMLAPEVELTSTAPFVPRDALRGGPARDAVADLCTSVRLDLTRKQLTREQATWTVRLEGDAGRRGRIEADIDGGRVTRLRLGPS